MMTIESERIAISTGQGCPIDYCVRTTVDDRASRMASAKEWQQLSNGEFDAALAGVPPSNYRRDNSRRTVKGRGENAG